MNSNFNKQNIYSTNNSSVNIDGNIIQPNLGNANNQYLKSCYDTALLILEKIMTNEKNGKFNAQDAEDKRHCQAVVANYLATQNSGRKRDRTQDDHYNTPKRRIVDIDDRVTSMLMGSRDDATKYSLGVSNAVFNLNSQSPEIPSRVNFNHSERINSVREEQVIDYFTRRSTVQDKNAISQQHMNDRSQTQRLQELSGSRNYGEQRSSVDFSQPSFQHDSSDPSQILALAKKIIEQSQTGKIDQPLANIFNAQLMHIENQPKPYSKRNFGDQNQTVNASDIYNYTAAQITMQSVNEKTSKLDRFDERSRFKESSFLRSSSRPFEQFAESFTERKLITYPVKPYMANDERERPNTFDEENISAGRDKQDDIGKQRTTPFERNAYFIERSRFDEGSGFQNRGDESNRFDERKRFEGGTSRFERSGFDGRDRFDETNRIDERNRFDGRTKSGEGSGFDERQRNRSGERNVLDEKGIFDERNRFDERGRFDEINRFDARTQSCQGSGFDVRGRFDERDIIRSRERNIFDEKEIFEGRNRFDERGRYDEREKNRSVERNVFDDKGIFDEKNSFDKVGRFDERIKSGKLIAFDVRGSFDERIKSGESIAFDVRGSFDERERNRRAGRNVFDEKIIFDERNRFDEREKIEAVKEIFLTKKEYSTKEIDLMKMKDSMREINLMKMEDLIREIVLMRKPKAVKAVDLT